MNIINMLFAYRGNAAYDLPRTIFASIDGAVYWFIAKIYNLIQDLARVDLFSESTMNDFYTKVYLLLTVFMLFKLTFSIISYVLDPNKVKDKQIGVGNIIKNVLIMLIMLLSAPVAFNMLKRTQNAILDDNIIFDFIFIKMGDVNDEFYVEQNRLVIGNEENCKFWASDDAPHLKERILKNDKNGVEKPLHVFTGGDSKIGSWVAASEGDYIALAIYRTFFNLGIPTPGQFKHVENYNSTKEDNNSYGYLCNDLTDANVYDMTAMINDKIDRGTKEYYVIDYKWGIATGVGVFILLLFLSICFDVAVRTIKLSFLQLIAPLAIMTYVDPNSSKNGTFSRWLKDVGRTWASLFIRLFAVFFAVYIIKSLDSGYALKSITGDGYEQQSTDFFIMLMLIIGALMFAKQLPKIIEDLIPGLKLGNMELNPFRKISNEALGGKQLVGLGRRAVRGAGGAAVGLGVGLVGGRDGRRFSHAIWSGLRGAATGLFGDKSLSYIRANQAAYNAKMRLADAQGATLGGRLRAGVSDFFGTRGELDRIEEQERMYDANILAAKTAMRTNKARIDSLTKADNYIKQIHKRGKEQIASGTVSGSEQYTRLNNRAKQLEELYKKGNVNPATGKLVTEQELKAAKTAAAKELEHAGALYVTRVLAGRLSDNEITSTYSEYNAYMLSEGHNYGYSTQTTGAGLSTQLGIIENDIRTAKNANAPFEAQITRNQTAKDNLQQAKDVAKANKDHAVKFSQGGKK